MRSEVISGTASRWAPGKDRGSQSAHKDPAAPQPKVLLLGALPPPYIGPTLATQVLLSSELRELFDLIHLDTSDHRPAHTLGRIDLTNIWLAVRSYAALAAKLARYYPDVVYLPISQTAIGYLKDSIYILVAKLFRRRVVCHLRGGNFRNWLEGASWPVRCYVRAVHRLVDAQVVLGECLRPLFDGLLPPERVFVVPNGKDVTIPPRRRQGGPVRVLFLANMMRTKGVLEVLYAVPEVVQRFPNVEFVFAGAWRDADVRDEVTGFLESHPDLPISWLGPVTGEEKYQLLADSDIFVFPTYYPPEGHPWVIVEAMAAGLPIVTCDQGAIRESVIDGYNGFLVEKRNPRAVAETLIQLASQTHLRHALGASSRRLYQLFFTEAAMAYKLRHVFDYVLIARPRRPSTA